MSVPARNFGNFGLAIFNGSLVPDSQSSSLPNAFQASSIFLFSPQRYQATSLACRPHHTTMSIAIAMEAAHADLDAVMWTLLISM